jgi:hypothetical protein
MTETEHLIQKLNEECNEVAKEASKCNLFGLDDVNAVEVKLDPAWPTNRYLLAQEIDDLEGVIAMLRERGILPASNPERVAHKKVKVLRWMDYARKKGTLVGDGETRRTSGE